MTNLDTTTNTYTGCEEVANSEQGAILVALKTTYDDLKDTYDNDSEDLTKDEKDKIFVQLRDLESQIMGTYIPYCAEIENDMINQIVDWKAEVKALDDVKSGAIEKKIFALETELMCRNRNKYNQAPVWSLSPVYVSPRSGVRLATMNPDQIKMSEHGNRDCGLRVKTLTKAIETINHYMSDFTREKPESVPHARAGASNEHQTFQFKQVDEKLAKDISWTLQHLNSITERVLGHIDNQIQDEVCPVHDRREKTSKGGRAKSVSFSVGDKVQLTKSAIVNDIFDLYSSNEGDTMVPDWTYQVVEINTGGDKIFLDLVAYDDLGKSKWAMVNAKHVKKVKKA